MTNKERYQRAFSALHASDVTIMEVTQMKRSKKIFRPRLIAAGAAAALLLALATAAYAADVGGIRRTIQIWVRGEQTDAILEITPGDITEYTLTYQDENGEEHTMGGGGIAIEPDGRERPLTEEELLEEINSPDVYTGDDGTVRVSWRGQTLDITDKFEGGVCYVQLQSGDETIYLTVRADGGYAYSAHSYPHP